MTVMYFSVYTSHCQEYAVNSHTKNVENFDISCILIFLPVKLSSGFSRKRNRRTKKRLQMQPRGYYSSSSSSAALLASMIFWALS